ncbi:MAG: hypothetical protein GX594_04010 [Pirellulaceae bacterium]|nr:hypothetical protein [Pirellulaceae bacterium]
MLVDPPAAGSWNMAVDEALLEAAAAEGRATLRFYQWEEPTLSLGYFQEYADRFGHAASTACPAVRRSSGGGAIMHDRELTYSLAVPEGHPLVAERMRTYRVIHESLIETLKHWGVEAMLYTCYMAKNDSRGQTAPGNCGNETRRDRRLSASGYCESENGEAGMLSASGYCDDDVGNETAQSRPGGQPFLCFRRRALGDVLLGGVKIAGSAQRRRRGAILQHGSVLLARSDAAPELDGIKERSGKSISADNLIEAWAAKLADILAVEWSPSNLSEGDRRRAAALDAGKYAAASWTKNRGRG